MRGFTAAVFGLTLASLIPFWAVAGTRPAGNAVLWVLYGVLIASGTIFLATYRAQVWAWARSRTGSAGDVAELSLGAVDRLRGALRTAEREGNGLAGEAAALEPIGNSELLDDLVRRYNAFEARVADVLAATDLLDRQWRVEWLRDPEWHYSGIYPASRADLDQMARMIGHRVRLLDAMVSALKADS